MTKTLTIIILSLTLLFNCNIISDLWYQSKASNHELYYHPDFETLNTLPKIANYINTEITNIPDKVDNWKNPQQTLADGYGDCDDIGVLFLNIAYFTMNIKLNLILVDNSDSNKLTPTLFNYSIIDGGPINHATIEYQNKVYNIYTGYILYYQTIGYKYTFDEIFN